MKLFNIKKIWLVIFVVVFSSIIFVKAYSPQDNVSAPVLENNPVVQVAQPTPTPFLFQEITIPYLRQRTYKSSLGSLMKTYENSNYTAYLTSYDSDGLKVNGLLTQPKENVPDGGWPAIIFIHGYITPKQ